MNKYITENILALENNINSNIVDFFYDKKIYDNLNCDKKYDITFITSKITNKFFGYLFKFKFNHPNDGKEYVARFINCELLEDGYKNNFKHYKIRYENIIFIDEIYINRRIILDNLILKNI